MPLSDDQRAMLQLLLERGQSYDDIGSLLGLGTDQVRRRAREALTEIGGKDPDREVAITDYLLGQADPISRADVARHLQGDGEAHALAEQLSTQLRVLAPSATLPELPAAKGGRRPVAARSGSRRERAAEVREAKTESARSSAKLAPSRSVEGGLSTRQRQLIAALVGGGVLIAAIVLIATGVFGGDEDDGGATTTAANGNGQNANNTSGLTRAVLAPQDGGDAKGIAVFARVRDRAVLQLAIAGLDPTPEGLNHVVWLYGSDESAFPVAFETVTEDGRINGLAPLPAEVLAALQEGTFDSIDVGIANRPEIIAEFRKAGEKGLPPPYVGESVMRGPITGPGFEGGQESGSGGNQPEGG